MLRSIRWTLQLWHAGLLTVVLLAFGGVTHFEIRRARFAQIDADLERTTQLVGAGVRPPRRSFRDRDGPDERPFDGPPRPTEFGLSDGLRGRFEEASPDGTYFVIWDRMRNVIGRSAGAPAVPTPPPSDDPGPPWEQGRRTGGPASQPDRGWRPPPPQPPTLRFRDGMREAVVDAPFGTYVVVGRPVAAVREELVRLAWLMTGTGVGVLVVGLIGGLALARRVTRPIESITAAAKSIGASNLSRRIDLSDADSELGQLGLVLNGAFDRLEGVVRQQVRFTADASHELRTPLAVMHTAVQLALSRERTPDEYRKTLATCRRASTRMKDLVDSLLLLAGVDTGRLTLDRRPVDLAEIARDGVELIGPLAAAKRVTVTGDLSPVRVDGDVMRLGQVVTNLLSNAVRYNREGGDVTVRVARDDATAVLRVTDTGIGVPADHLPHLFDRFYRVDPARSRAEGGSGLGLAIVRGIVDAHGGTIAVESADENGTTFTVRLPAI